MNICHSCEILMFVYSGLAGFDQQVFNQLASSIFIAGSSITTLVLLIMVVFRSQMGLDQMASPEVANKAFGIIFRLGIAVAFLSSYSIWKVYVLDIIDSGVGTVVTTAMQGIPAQSLSTAPAGTPQHLAFTFQGLAATEDAIFTPLTDIIKSVEDTFSLSTIGQSILIYMAVAIMFLLGIIDLAIVLIFYSEFMFWRFMIGAFGPLIIFAWVFEQTRPAAWSAIKLLLQSGLTLVMVTGVIAIIVAAFNNVAANDAIDPVSGTIDVRQLANLFSLAEAGKSMLIQILAVGLLLLVKILAFAIVFASVGSGGGRGGMQVISKIAGR